MDASVGSEPFVSVVTPFYNTDGYLSECIESVLAQSHRNFEYILVNNQSTDRSADIAASYAARESRIRLVDTPRFFTQVQNYNFALRQISSESRYCKVVQADDWLFPRCLAEMAALAEAHPSVAVVGSYYLCGKSVLGTGLAPSQVVIPGREACRLHLMQGIYLFGSPTVVLHRADQVRERTPFYEEGRLFEDGEVVYELLRDGDLGFVHQILSYTRTHDDSIWGALETYDPLALLHVILLHRYGHEFLSPAELAMRLKAREGDYYRMLARAWLRRREPAFWKFHADGLGNAGLELRTSDIIKYTMPALLEAVVAPPLAQRLTSWLRWTQRWTSP